MSGVGSILVIDDEPVLQDVLKTLLEANGFAYHSATTAAAGMQSLREEEIDVVLLDLMLPDSNGLDLLPQIKAYDPHLPV
ncbi:MAG: sigma-54-dependent Fis family transcriptional regulator, partial [Acidobacteria bacterium]|nr:sigma-54-dependent Fis family transcriptional regulator [Acidobacteriota bacterium]